jgi:hypothetical protein
VASAVTVHAGHEAGGGVPHGAVEVVARALAVEHARRGVVEKAGGEVGNAKHLRPQHSRLSVRHSTHFHYHYRQVLNICSLQNLLLQKCFSHANMTQMMLALLFHHVVARLRTSHCLSAPPTASPYRALSSAARS